MVLSKLKLNPDKNEFIGFFFCSKAHNQKPSSHFPINILGSLLYPADIVKDLGSMLTFLNMLRRLVKMLPLHTCPL